MLCSIIIVTYNNLFYNKLCIESVSKNTNRPFEFIFIDNNSTDGTVEYLKTIPNAKIIENSENRGFGFACNQGIKKASGDFIVFLNNDTVVGKNWLNLLIEKLNKHSEFGIAGPMSFNSIKGPQKVKEINYDQNRLLDFATFVENHYQENKNQLEEVYFLSGLCLVIKRAVIEKIGGFDPSFTIGWFEDDDFCLRAVLAGYKLMIVREVFIHHFGSRTFDLIQIDEDRLFTNNLNIFKIKWSLPDFAISEIQPELISPEDFADFGYFSPDHSLNENKPLIYLEQYRKKEISLNKFNKIIQISLIIDENNLEARYLQGLIFYLKRDFSEAIKVFQFLLLKKQANQDLFLLMAKALAKAGDMNLSELFFQKAKENSRLGFLNDFLKSEGLDHF